MQPKSYILYSRCSTDEQRQKGNSHEYQADGIRRSGTVRVGELQEVAYLHDTVTGTRFDNRAAGLDAAYKICERNRGTVFAASAPEYKGRILRAVFPEGFSIEKNAGKVRTPAINEVIFALCSKSIHSAVLEIENGPSFETRPVEGGQPDRYRTHYQALKLLFAA